MPNLTGSDVHVDKPLDEEEETGTVSAKGMSREYLSAYFENAQRTLQGWQHNQIHSLALPSAGGAAGRRMPEHSALEKALLAKIRRDQISKMESGELLSAWKDLETWHTLASKKRLDCSDYERAAGLIADELEKRGGMTLDPDGHLARAVMRSSGPEIAVSSGEMISKAWGEKQIVWYAVAVPGETDTYGDVISEEDVEEACHRYMMSPRMVYIEHGEHVGLNAAGQWPENLTGKAFCVECGLTLAPVDDVFGQPLPARLPARTWYVANWYRDPELWAFLRDVQHGISWRGRARRSQA